MSSELVAGRAEEAVKAAGVILPDFEPFPELELFDDQY